MTYDSDFFYTLTGAVKMFNYNYKNNWMWCISLYSTMHRFQISDVIF